MTKIYFEELMQELGLQVQGDIAYGLDKGLPLSLELTKKGKSPILTGRIALDGPAKSAAALAKKQKVSYLRWMDEGDVLVCVLTPPGDFYIKSTIHSMLGAARAAMQGAGRKPAEICPLCGNPGGDVYACLDDAYRPVHSACLATRLALPDEDTTVQVPVRGHYATGILGALIGALIGAVPPWIQILNRGAVDIKGSVLYAFIPIFSALLYRLFRGKARRNFAGVTVLLCSFVAVLALEINGYWLLLQYQYTQYGYPISIWQAIPLYFKTHNFFNTLGQRVLPLVCMLIGVFPASRVLRSYSRSRFSGERTVRGARFVRQSALPVRGQDASSGEPTPKAAPPADGARAFAGPDGYAPRPETRPAPGDGDAPSGPTDN